MDESSRAKSRRPVKGKSLVLVGSSFGRGFTAKLERGGSHQDPSTGTPGISEVDNKEPDHRHGSPASGALLLPLVRILGENDGDDEMAEAECVLVVSLGS